MNTNHEVTKLVSKCWRKKQKEKLVATDECFCEVKENNH